MAVYYLENIFQGEGDRLDFLLELVFSFPQSNEFLYFEYGFYYVEPFNEGIETFKDQAKSLWFRPSNKMEARSIHESFVVNCVVLTKDKEIDSCKLKLSIVEAPESIELKVIEMREGDFQELLETTLQPFIKQGIRVITEHQYNDKIEEQLARNQWVFINKTTVD